MNLVANTGIATPPDFQAILQARGKGLDTTRYGYKFGDSSYGLDVAVSDNMDIDEGRMAVVIPFADGRRRDGVGDLLEVGGIRTERHAANPICLYDHGKTVSLPIALCEDPETKAYTVQIDAVNQCAKALAFFYRGTGMNGVDRGREKDHALFCEQLFDLIAKRYIRAGSIGYQVIKAMPLQPDYERGTPQGLHLLSVLMLECSAVVLPANQDTTRKMLALPAVCGKPLSPVLVKSLSAMAPEEKQVVTGGYEGKMKQGRAQSWQMDPSKLTNPKIQVWSWSGTMMTAQMSLEDARELVKQGTHFVMTDAAIGEYDPKKSIKSLRQKYRKKARSEEYIPASRENAQKICQICGNQASQPHRRHCIHGTKIEECSDPIHKPFRGPGWKKPMTCPLDKSIKSLGPEDADGNLLKVGDKVKDVQHGKVETGQIGTITALHFGRLVTVEFPGRKPMEGYVSTNLRLMKSLDLKSLRLKRMEFDTFPSRPDARRFADELERSGHRVYRFTQDQRGNWLVYWETEGGKEAVKALRLKYRKKQSPAAMKSLKKSKELDNLIKKKRELEEKYHAGDHSVIPEWEAIKDKIGELQAKVPPVSDDPFRRIKSQTELPLGWNDGPHTAKPGLEAAKLKRMEFDSFPSRPDARRFADELERSGHRVYRFTQDQRGNWLVYWETEDGKEAVKAFRKKAGIQREYPIYDRNWKVVGYTTRNGWKKAAELLGESPQWTVERNAPEGPGWIAGNYSKPPEIGKSFDLKSIRMKYRSAKNYRRKLRKSVAGSSVLHVAEKDLAAVKQFANDRGMECKHVGSGSMGLERVKLIGDDGSIDEAAKRYGKALENIPPGPPVDKEQYINMLMGWGRSEMLKIARAAGITAHKIKTDRELAEVLWEMLGSKRASEKTLHKTFEFHAKQLSNLQERIVSLQKSLNIGA